MCEVDIVRLFKKDVEDFVFKEKRSGDSDNI